MESQAIAEDDCFDLLRLAAYNHFQVASDSQMREALKNSLLSEDTKFRSSETGVGGQYGICSGTYSDSSTESIRNLLKSDSSYELDSKATMSLLIRWVNSETLEAFSKCQENRRGLRVNILPEVDKSLVFFQVRYFAKEAKTSCKISEIVVDNCEVISPKQPNAFTIDWRDSILMFKRQQTNKPCTILIRTDDGDILKTVQAFKPDISVSKVTATRSQIRLVQVYRRLIDADASAIADAMFIHGSACQKMATKLPKDPNVHILNSISAQHLGIVPRVRLLVAKHGKQFEESRKILKKTIKGLNPGTEYWEYMEDGKLSSSDRHAISWLAEVRIGMIRILRGVIRREGGFWPYYDEFFDPATEGIEVGDEKAVMIDGQPYPFYPLGKYPENVTIASFPDEWFK